MNCNNALIHVYPRSPAIVKACINLREGRKIRVQIPMKDADACKTYFAGHFPGVPYRIINHKLEA